MFAADGLAVPMREIARHDEVGPATLYRHFPTKEALATEAFADRMRACYAIVGEGLADLDPGHGFTSMIEGLCELHARNRGFAAAFPHALDFAADRERAVQSIAELTRRAREAGHLRPDVEPADVLLVLTANGGPRRGFPALRRARGPGPAGLSRPTRPRSPGGGRRTRDP